jgi:inner membrane protein
MKIEITNTGKWYQSLTLKLGLLAFMGILFLIPLEMIKSVIKERQKNAEEVKKEISAQWAENQTVAGPILNVPVRSVPEDKNEKPVESIWHILPETLDINGSINPEIRYRGIYQSVIYNSEFQVGGEIIIPVENDLNNYEKLWDKAYFTFGITDNRGLKGDVVLSANSKSLPADPGTRDHDVFQSGVSFPYPVSDASEKIPFNLKLKLSGSEGLYVVPLGKTTHVHLRSDWKSPSFSGSFLPSKRTINETGFDASWEITHLNRNFPQTWTRNSFSPLESSFGVDLFLPVDHYQKSWRSARYGILFIALTFLVLIFLEITRKETIHIFHYFLVSLGLVLFFSLLNSISEQTGFNLAYLIASSATIILISLFTGSLFKNPRMAFIIFGALVILYLFIYILLTLNDYAYLAGNIGLFILLAVIMRLVAKMNFFKNEELSERSDL